jgi:hypothetical protein
MNAIDLIDELIGRIEAEGPWNVNETPDGHSRAWHGVFILRHAGQYLLTGKIESGLEVDGYTPIYTR